MYLTGLYRKQVWGGWLISWKSVEIHKVCSFEVWCFKWQGLLVVSSQVSANMSGSPSPAPGLPVIYVKLLRYKNTISSLSFSICASLIFIGILNCRLPTPASNNRVCVRCWLWTVMVMGHAGGSFREWHVGDYTPTKTDIVSDEIRSPNIEMEGSE